MRKLITLGAAGALALALSLSATAQSQAFFPALGLLAVGTAVATTAAVTSAAADGYYAHDAYWAGPRWRAHVAACENAYQSYDLRSDTYVRRINGRLTEVYCEL
ncbi:MAG TPA: hypothetical protein VHB74_05795 [Devosia sp.]|nr:hypothetical protein [Devosia sp.]